LIPAGTGLPAYRKLRIDTLGAVEEKLSLEEAAERIEGVALPTPELATEGAVPAADGVEGETDKGEPAADVAVAEDEEAG
ncbi:MAG: hypothetical protein ACPG3X_08435, partial [Opitutales bacterium]